MINKNKMKYYMIFKIFIVLILLLSSMIHLVPLSTASDTHGSILVNGTVMNSDIQDRKTIDCYPPHYPNVFSIWYPPYHTEPWYRVIWSNWWFLIGNPFPINQQIRVMIDSTTLIDITKDGNGNLHVDIYLSDESQQLIELLAEFDIPGDIIKIMIYKINDDWFQIQALVTLEYVSNVLFFDFFRDSDGNWWVDGP